MNLRRPMTALFALVLAFSALFAAPTSASAGAGSGCDYFQTEDNYFGALVGSTSTVWDTMAAMDIYVDTNRFDPCNNAQLGDNGGISAWVALEIPGSKHSIAQIGVIKCNQQNGGLGSTYACGAGHVGTLQYFYATGHNSEWSCGWGDKAPLAIYLGEAPTTAGYHSFKVQYKTETDRVWFLIDGTLRANVDAGAMCWLNSFASRPAYVLERWDTDDGATTIHFNHMTYEKNDDGVTRPSYFDPSACQLDSEFSCVKSTTSDHYTFSVN